MSGIGSLPVILRGRVTRLILVVVVAGGLSPEYVHQNALATLKFSAQQNVARQVAFYKSLVGTFLKWIQ